MHHWVPDALEQQQVKGLGGSLPFYSPVLNLAVGVASPRGNASLLPERAASHTATDQDCDWPVICLSLYKTESPRTKPTKHQQLGLGAI